jgi:integrase
MAAHKMKDGRWCVWLDLGSDVATGRRLRKRVEARTKRDVEIKAAALRERHIRGENVLDKPRTLAQLLHEWADTTEQQDKAANTMKAYRGAIKNQLIPRLGASIVPKLRAREVQHVFNDLAKQLAPPYIRLIKTVLVAALDLAIEQTEISINVAEKVRIPIVKRKPGRTLTPDEVRALRQACSSHPYGLAIELALMGLRRSEISGLRWDDFDELAGTLIVRRQVQYIDKQWVEIETKADSDRMLTLGPKLTAALRQQRWDQAEKRDAMGWAESGYIFVSHRNGGVCPTDTIYKSFKVIAETAGITTARLHDCRHTAATKLLSEGEDIATVAEVLGHASPQVTALVYAHALPHKVASASRRLEDLYE